VAKANAAKYALKNVSFYRSDWLGKNIGHCERFDAIISNPPYIAENDPHLHEGDVRFEPRRALVSGKDGLASQQDSDEISGLTAIREIIVQAPDYLHAKGWLMLEHGYNQGSAVRALMRERGFTGVTTWNDLNGHERVSWGRL